MLFWKTVWILISWFLKKPADLDLHCFQLSLHLSRKFIFDINTVRTKLCCLCIICPLGQVTFLWTSALCIFTFPWASIKCCYFHTPGISDDIPPQLKIFNIVIPILRAFYSFPSNWSVASPIKPHIINKIKTPLGPQIIICIDIGREILNLNFYWLCVTILHLLLNNVGQFHLFPRFNRNFTLLIRFEPLREPLMRIPTVYIL